MTLLGCCWFIKEKIFSRKGLVVGEGSYMSVDYDSYEMEVGGFGCKKVLICI